MGKYIKIFKTHSAYKTYIEGNNKILPNVSCCLQEIDTHYNPQPLSESYLTFVALEDTTFTFDNAVIYSLDGILWSLLTAGTPSPTVEAGNSIMWKGNLTPVEDNGVGTFSSTGKFEVKGNPMSLLYGDDFKGQTDLTGKDYAFEYLFYNNTNVINAKDLSLPATTLTSSCYEVMFSGCTSLTTAPSILPATTLASNCYSSMFYGCTSLTTAPELPAATLVNGCYGSMFQGCTSLTTAPELSATTLASSCYEAMFYRCTSLTTAPELPATTLAEQCYASMFQSCTSLAIAPELPATTLVNNCYFQMFRDCRNLNYIKAMFTTTPSASYTQNWVSGVAANGTFVKNSTATWNVTGADGIPSGWTVQTASA